MKITSFACVGVLALSATSAHSGGWETGRLNSGVLYQDGNYVESSFGSLNYSINGTTQAGVTHGMAKDQNRMSVSGKLAIGDFDIGLTSFSSGAIQMDGQNPAAGLSVVPSADVKVYTQALMVRYKLNDNFSVIGGARQVKLKASSVKTVFATYNVDSTKKNRRIIWLGIRAPRHCFEA
jgi:predicted porin